MLTDYLRFCLVRLDSKAKAHITREVRICEFSQIKATLKSKALLESKAKELLELFTLFFTHSPKPINTALEFANALSLRTKLLKDELSQNKDNIEIQGLFNTFKEALYKELEFESFCDSFAQTLTYSLFLSRLNNTEDKAIDLFNAKKFIPKSFPLIKAMSGFLNNLQDLDSIEWLLDEILQIINHINIADLTKELNTIAEKNLLGHYTHKDPYLHFYETFLSSYDPRLRELRGVYYTPASVVSFIIEAIDSILKSEFSQKQGLASALHNEHITLLDFATGTGTFLLESFRKALQDIPTNSPKYNPKALIERFYGFEFLIAPYTIAHLKISQSFKEEFDAPLSENESLNITLTNTLYFQSQKDEINKQSNIFAGMIELAEEFKKAQTIKENKILIITGNPPYSGASSNKGLYEKEVQVAYKNPMETPNNPTAILKNNKIEKEKNPKWLLDDYVKFIRFAESKIESQEGGIFAFISNNSFLDNPTFRGMRYHLMQSFDTLYILDLHGNTRKKELSPDGSKDENVFDIMQGVSINIFMKNRNSPLGMQCDGFTKFPEARTPSPLTSENLVKTPTATPQNARICESKSNPNSRDSKAVSSYSKVISRHSEAIAEESTINDNGGIKSPHCQIYHYDLYGKRKDKYNFLYDNSLDSIPWNRLNPKPPFFLFIPQNESLREEYDKGFSVKDMFRISNTGICSQRDSVVIHKTKESIEELITDFCTKSKDEIVKKYNIEKDGRDWQIQRAIDSVKKSEQNKSGVITQIHYRPFDYHWTYYNGESRAFMAYPRKDVMEHFLQNTDNVGLIYTRRFTNTKSGQCFTTKHISDLRTWTCPGMEGGDYISPLYLQNTESTQKNLKKSEKESLFDDEDIFKGKERIENFTPEFRSFVDSKYTWNLKDIKANPQLFLDSHTLTPESILGYIYAVLFHKDYREKYIDFLKIDFPKIPFVESKEKFIALSKLGLELMSVHLMADNERERERERTEINENESQYWANLAKTVSKSGIQTHIHSSHDNGDVLYLKQNQRRELHIPTLSLQHQESKEDSMQRVNIALVCDRGCKLHKIDNIFITQNIIDLHLVGSGSYVFPLYLYNKES